MVLGRASGVEREAELLKALAHPVRLLLLDALTQSEECVCHLAFLLRRPQPYVSKQLAELREAGLVTDRRKRQRIFYRLAEPNVVALLSAARALSGRAQAGTRQSLPGCPCPRCRQVPAEEAAAHPSGGCRR